MAKALSAYNAKRDFSKTREPAGKAKASKAVSVKRGANAKSKAGAKSRHKTIFVIQEHHATRLHWDFRLEVDGVLASWAVPKEPTMDESVRRLAVHVEDHPLEYAKFHGTIPAGEYGGGKVMIWDHGTYENILATKPTPAAMREAIDAGHVEVNLKGKKLTGAFALIRLPPDRGKDNWLLLKMKHEPPASA